jgi:hypothetical protein
MGQSLPTQPILLVGFMLRVEHGPPIVHGDTLD